MKWAIGILILAITYGITKGLGHLGYGTRNSGWGVFLLIAIPLVLAGILFLLETPWWTPLVVGGISFGIMIAGRNGLILGMGVFDV